MPAGKMIIEGESFVPKQRWGKLEILMFLLLLGAREEPVIDFDRFWLSPVGLGNLEPAQTKFPNFNTFFRSPEGSAKR